MAWTLPNVAASRLVVVDPRVDDYACLVGPAKANDIRLTVTSTGGSALRLAPTFADAVWLVCPALPDLDGIDLVEMLGSLQPNLPVVVIDNEYDRRREVRSIRARAIQYVCKPMHPAWLRSWRRPDGPTPQPPAPSTSRVPTDPDLRFPTAPRSRS